MSIGVLNLIEYPLAGDHHWNDVVVRTLRTLGEDVTEYRHKRTRGVQGTVRAPLELGPLRDLVSQHDVLIVSNAFSGDTRNLQLTELQRDVVNALSRTRTRTIVVLHNQIDMYAPYARRLVHQILCEADVPVATARENLDAYPCDHLMVMPYLPYEETVAASRVVDHERGVIMTGRISTTKGQRFLATMATSVNANITVMGRDQMGSARSMRVALENRGMVAEYEVPPGNAWSSPWVARLTTGTLFRYGGAYQSALHVPWKLGTVHLNLTDESISRGHLEYTSLEGIDAGLTAVVPEHALRGLSYGCALPVPFQTRQLADPCRVAEVVNAALDAWLPRWVMAAQDIAMHDPKRYVKALLNQV